MPDHPNNAVVWNIDNLESIAGHAVTVVGSPKVIDAPKGKAVQFSGDGDALFLDAGPLRGWPEFTWEVLFRPDADGLGEQRFFHIQEIASQNRVMYETRLFGDRWFLDTFIKSGDSEQPLGTTDFLHPVGRWFHAALVCDGESMAHYVDGVREFLKPIRFAPMDEARVSIGCRINQVCWFKGAVRMARFSPRALKPEGFLRG
jgi:hypothetical protein